MRKGAKHLCMAGLGVMLAAGMLAGCSENEKTETAGSAAEGSTEQGQQSSGDKIELTVWVRASSKENSQKVTFDEFNESQDMIHVNVESYAETYPEVLKLAFNSGDTPDIFSTVGIDLKSCAEAGLVSPLDPFLTDEYKSQFMSSAFSVFNYDDQVYAIPDMTRYIRLFYNKDLFRQAGLNPETPPSSLEEMYDMAKKIMEAGNGEFYGFGLPIKSSSTWERYVDDISVLSGLTGPCGFDYTTGKFDFAKEKPIIEYFGKMYKDGVLMPGSESIDIEMLRANFVAGKVGMYFDGNWMINGYNNEIEGGKDADWETALVPIFEGQKRAKDYLMLDSGIAISEKCQNKEAAFEAIQFYLHNYYTAPAKRNPDVVLPSCSLIPADNEAVNSQPQVQALKGMKGIMEGEDQLSAFPVIPSTLLTLEGDDRNSVYPLLVIQGDSMDIDAEMQKLSDTYNAALEKAVSQGTLKESDIKPDGFDYYTR